MNIIDLETLLIIIFVLVDDWYQTQQQEPQHQSPGVKPRMSDSEILT